MQCQLESRLLLSVPSPFLFTADLWSTVPVCSPLPPRAARAPWPSTASGLLLLALGGRAQPWPSAAPAPSPQLLPSQLPHWDQLEVVPPHSSQPSAGLCQRAGEQPALSQTKAAPARSPTSGLSLLPHTWPERGCTLRAEGGEQSSAQVGGTGLPLNPRLPGDRVLAQTHPRAGFTSSRCCWSKSGGQRGDEQLQRRYLPGAGFKGRLCPCHDPSKFFFPSLRCTSTAGGSVTPLSHHFSVFCCCFVLSR